MSTALGRKTTRMTARASPYHSAVTIIGAETTIGISPRRSKRVKLKTKTESLSDVNDTISDNAAVSETKGKSNVGLSSGSSPRKPKSIRKCLDTPHPAPAGWRETYDTIKRQRAQIVAPVDTMGCEQAQIVEKDPKARRFSTLISLMLSSQTKDEVTDAAVSKLRTAVGGTLTVDSLLGTGEAAISEAIAKVGFWRRKTQYVKQTAERLRDDFDSDVPQTVEDLCSLPGVGPKMAFLALQIAWNINLGIGVDVHVHRITNRLGWHKQPTKNPEETRLNLESWLPTELHPEINHMLVGFGQTVCLPVGPRCDKCDLSITGLCPSAQKVKKRRSTVTRTSVVLAAPGPSIEIAIEENDDIIVKDEPIALVSD